MSLGSKLRPIVSKVVKPFGSSVTFRRVVTGAYNTTTGAVGETTTDTTINGVVSDVSLDEVGEFIQIDDRKITLPAVDLDNAPTTADRVVINRIVYQVVKVTSDEVNNNVLTYDLILRA